MASAKWSCSLVPSLPPWELALTQVPSTEHEHTVYVTISPHKDISEPSPHWLTNTNWFLSRPLATLLAGNCFLSLQLKGRLALKLQTVPMAKRGSFSPAVGWDPRITAAPLVNLWKKENRSCKGKALMSSRCNTCCTSMLFGSALAKTSHPEVACPLRTVPCSGGGLAVVQKAAEMHHNTQVLPWAPRGSPNHLSQSLPPPSVNHDPAVLKRVRREHALHLLQGLQTSCLNNGILVTLWQRAPHGGGCLLDCDVCCLSHPSYPPFHFSVWSQSRKLTPYCTGTHT